MQHKCELPFEMGAAKQHSDLTLTLIQRKSIEGYNCVCLRKNDMMIAF